MQLHVFDPETRKLRPPRTLWFTRVANYNDLYAFIERECAALMPPQHNSRRR